MKRDRERESIMVNLAPGSFRRHWKRREGGCGGLEGAGFRKGFQGQGVRSGPKLSWGAGMAELSPQLPRDLCPCRSACAAPQSSTSGRPPGWQERAETRKAIFSGPVVAFLTHSSAVPHQLPPCTCSLPLSFSLCCQNPRSFTFNSGLVSPCYLLFTV